MVELFEQDLNDDGRRSSKGNQLKWKHDQLWYKADYLGYEGLSEYIISKEQLDIAETLYGQNIKFTWQMNDVDAFCRMRIYIVLRSGTESGHCWPNRRENMHICL